MINRVPAFALLLAIAIIKIVARLYPASLKG
jgi:hypothetical protein